MMAKLPRRRLVIDADIAHSAGESEHPISSACRRFLATMLNFGHLLVMTDAIKKEWKPHISKYSRKWRRQMYARKLVIQIEVNEDETLREHIDAAVHWDQRETVDKDAHLIEAAIATDRLVTSRDETARKVFRNASVDVRQLRHIVWVNPTQPDEEPIDWLRNGARAEAHRELGA